MSTTTTPQAIQADPATIAEALHPLWTPGDIHELRIPMLPRGTIAGYFDAPEAMAKALAAWKGTAPGVYWTLNPVDPRLQARAHNRLDPNAKSTTNDVDVIRRRILLVDIDPIRPSGISSTDQEHAAAIEAATTINATLRDRGWPVPFFADSGNGVHLLYRIDLPNDIGNRELLRRVLHVLAAEFNNQATTLDTSVFNASRISKVYGTPVCKGDDTPDRPHRQAKILETPASWEAVPSELLRTVAETAPTEKPSVPGPSRQHNRTIPSIDEVREMLRCIPPTGDYQDHWLAVLMAVHDAYPGSEGVQLCEEWSPGKDGEIAGKFASFKRTGVGFGTLVRLAQQHGYLSSPRQRRTNGHTTDPVTGEIFDPTMGAKSAQVQVIDAGEKDPLILRAASWIALKRANEKTSLLYRYGGMPTRLERDDDGRPILRELGAERLRHELTNAARWIRKTATGEVPARPPRDLLQDLLADANPSLPVLTRIVESPVFAPNGDLQTRPGYHPASRTYYHAAPGFIVPEVPTQPTADQITRARSLILGELLPDFPFADQADRANAVALFLLPYVRDCIAGPTPLHMIEAPVAGSGKGLLASVVLSPALGRPPATLTAASDDDEWRKRITAKLLNAPAALLVDNINLALDSAALASALTATEYEDRMLGRNETLRLTVRCVWVATANNPTMTTEIARRCVRIRLQPDTDRPYELPATAFHHPQLGEWAETHRTELVHAALTLGRAWIAAGRPRSCLALGSYEHWAAVMGGILDVAGIPGFLANRAEFYEASDLEGNVWRNFVAAWWEKFAEQEVGTGDLFPLALECDGLNLGRGSERAQRVTFGMQLAKHKDRVIGEVRIVLAGQNRRASQWRLLPITRVQTTIDRVNLMNLGESSSPYARTREDGDIPGGKKIRIDSQDSHAAVTDGTGHANNNTNDMAILVAIAATSPASGAAPIDDIAAHLGLSVDALRPLLHQLDDRHLAWESGWAKPTDGGHSVRAWRLTESGQNRLRTASGHSNGRVSPPLRVPTGRVGVDRVLYERLIAEGVEPAEAVTRAQIGRVEVLTGSDGDDDDAEVI